MAKEIDLYSEIVNQARKNPDVSNVCIQGNCREWSTKTVIALMKIRKDTGLKINAEVREVFLPDASSHSFVRVKIGSGSTYLLDGIGVAKHGTYFGPEEEAPEHLRKSTYDVLNFEIPFDESY